MNNITGPPVEGTDFYGRTKELDFAWRHIKKGNSHILAAPRRVGKSSFGKRLLVKADKEGWNTLEINLEEITSEEAFISLFIEKLEQESWWTKFKTKSKEKIEKLLSSIKGSIEFEGIKGTVEWQKSKENIYDKLKQLLDHKEDTLIMIDEVTILLNSYLQDKENGLNNVTFFLNWLRSFRQVSGTKIRWVFCSSIGLDNFTNIHGLSYTFNDVPPFPLGAFDTVTGQALLENLAKSDNLEVPQEVIHYMLKKLGWLLPYFIQILHYKVNYLVQIQSLPISKKTVDIAYDQLMSENYLNTWDERLKDYKDLESHSRIILNKISQHSEGERRANLISKLNVQLNDPTKAELAIAKVLKMLINDGYLVEVKGKYLFRSPLLKDFWFNRFVK